MLYFDYTDSFKANHDHYKKMCKKLHPDMPTGSNNEFIAMKKEWDEYVKTVNSKNKNNDYGYRVSYATESNLDYNEIHKIFNDVLKHTNQSKEKEELIYKIENIKMKKKVTLVEIFDIGISFIKLKNQ